MEATPNREPAGGWLTSREAVKHFPSSRRPGKAISLSCYFRLVEEGLLGKDGRRHRLQAWKVGGTRCTTMEAIGAFIDALSRDPGRDDAPTIRTPAALRRADREAAARLGRLGA